MSGAWRRGRVGWGALLVSCLSFLTAYASGVNYTNVIPADETMVGRMQGTVSGRDSYHQVFGRSTGEIVMLTLEGSKLKSSYSSDNGATFSSEVVVDDDVVYDGAWRFLDWEVDGPKACLVSDGKLYVAMRHGDLGGDVGVRFYRSDDMGRTWQPAVDLVKRGDATHGVESVSQISANGTGRVAVMYKMWWSPYDTFVIASSNYGATWTTPVRLDKQDTTNLYPSSHGDLKVADAGNIYAVFVQDRGTGNTIWYTRSTNGGTSFDTERSVDSLLTAGQRLGSDYPDVEVGNDASVVLAFWDKYSNGQLYVVRSNNAGASYSKVYQTTAGSDGDKPRVQVHVASGTTVQLISVIPSASTGIGRRVSLHRSLINGSAFAALTQWPTVAHHCTVAHTPSGNWAVAFDDERNDIYGSTFTDVYVRVSTNDGVAWGAEQRADRDTVGTASSQQPIIVSGSGDNLFVAWRDGRLHRERGADIYANSSLANPLSLVNERRADADTEQDGNPQHDGTWIATDNVNHVYALFAEMTSGPQTDLYLAVSADRGKTFGVPRRVNDGTPGEIANERGQLNAYPDGTVYVAWIRWINGSGWQIVFRRSSDFGATWSAETNLAIPSCLADWPDLASTAAGRVYVAWWNCSSNQMLIARSGDGGQSFSSTTVGAGKWVTMCAQADQVVLVHNANNSAAADSVWGTVSLDGGATWSTTQLRPDAAASTAGPWGVACDGNGAAVATWMDKRSGVGEIYTNRYGGGAWLGDVAVSASSTKDRASYVQVFADANSFLVPYENSDGTELRLRRSLDGGLTYQDAVDFDSANPVPGHSANLWLSTDGAGNVWVSYQDRSAGAWSYVARHSSDLGANWGPPYRMHCEQPQGVLDASAYGFMGLGQPIAALPGAAFVIFQGDRPGDYGTNMVNAYEPGDLDRDGVATASDCNDADPAALHWPAEVGALALVKVTGGVRLSWTSQLTYAGSSTLYDFVSGDLGQLRASLDYSGASCLAGTSGEPPYDDFRSDPPPGEGFYYLLRARNTCGAGTYGDSGHVPDPRDGLDAASPCPYP